VQDLADALEYLDVKEENTKRYNDWKDRQTK
jgi:hypothetical protein